jgi:hypothetical protein
MITNTYQSGNTVRLSCEFYDFDKEMKDPTIIKLKIYDYKYNLLDEFTNVIRSEMGKYYFDYVTDVDNKTYIYEWYGELDGTPSLRRGSFITKFM